VTDNFPHEPIRIVGNSAFLTNRSAALKIRDQPLAQRGGHANVDQPPTRIDHSVNARTSRAAIAKRAANSNEILAYRKRFQSTSEWPERRAAEISELLGFDIPLVAALHRSSSMLSCGAFQCTEATAWVEIASTRSRRGSALNWQT
jgi:hypothetical protein